MSNINNCRANINQDVLNAEHLEQQRTSNLKSLFEPSVFGLDSSFHLTNFSDYAVHGDRFNEDGFNQIDSEENGGGDGFEHDANMNSNGLTVKLDCSIQPLCFGSLCIVQSTNVLSMIVDDPFMMGKIACSSILSDLYAIGITECDNIQMNLSSSLEMSSKERKTVMTLLYDGFKDCAQNANTVLAGGTIVLNPWCTIGGVATKICERNECIIPDGAILGDVIILTKPLGTQVIIDAYQWINVPERWNRIKPVVSEEEVRIGYVRAMDSMARLNRSASKHMRYYNSHCATVVSKLGVLGHAKKLVKQQKNDVSFVIHNLPILSKVAGISKVCGNSYQLLKGYCPEIAGGLLICLPREQAAAFCRDIEKETGYQSWIIGIVENGNKTARIIDKPRIIEFPPKD